MTAQYSVIYRGRILEGFDFEAAKEKLITKFSVSKDKAEKILQSRRAILKKTFDEATARKLGLALKRAGLDVVLTKGAAALPQAQAAPAYAPQEVLETDTNNVSVQALKKGNNGAVDATAMRIEKDSGAEVSPIPFEFRGTGFEYFKIWLVNAILTIITLGIYSPWAKVRRKQYFYGNTRLQGSSFEYLADPKKILMGRFIAGGFFLLYMVFSNLIPLTGIIFSLLFLIFLPWLMVRALAFNARNSAYRNIRFGFEGTIKEAAKVFVLWPILAPLTLGILSPYAYYRQKKFIVENSTYGTSHFSFTGTARDFYRVFLWALVPVIIGIVLVVAAFSLLQPVAVLVGLVMYLYLFAFFSVKMTNLIFNSSRIATHGLRADLNIKDYLVLVITNSVGIAFTLGLFHPWATVRTMRYKFTHLQLRSSGDLDSFVAGQQKPVSAVAEEMGNFFDFDIGL